MNKEDWKTNIKIRNRNWGVGMLQGLVQIIIGVWLLATTSVSSLVLTQILGIFWLSAGIVNIMEIFTSGGRPSRIILAISGILGIAAGIFVSGQPFADFAMTLSGLSLLIGYIGAAIGIINIIRAIKGGGINPLILGLTALLAGISVLYSPTTTFLPVILGTLILAGGIVSLIYAFRVRYSLREENEEMNQPNLIGQKGGETKNDPIKRENELKNSKNETERKNKK
ncbi:MAG TPA: DUF308 domain-containing protein [Patescibacteria group bacterium]